MNKIITVNGILVATQNDLSKHAENTVSHITEEERTAWNKKADAADLDSKVDTATFNTRQTDTAVHVTETEKETWNSGMIVPSPFGYPQIGDYKITLGSRGYSLTLEAGIQGGTLFLSSTMGNKKLYISDLFMLAEHTQELLALCNKRAANN